MKKILLDSIASIIVIVGFIPMLCVANVLMIRELIKHWVPAVFDGVHNGNT